MASPEPLEALLAGQAPFGGWQSGTPLRFDFVMAAHADERALLRQRRTGAADSRLSLLFGAQISQLVGEIPELQSARPSHLVMASFKV